MTAELDALSAACLFPSFTGHEPPDWIRRLVASGTGGVVLFARNVRDADQVRLLTAALRAERVELLIGIDEEGGDVTRLETERGSSYPGNAALGAVDDVELTERVAGAIAGDLTAVGINLDLAPVADVNTDPRNPIIGVRAFGSEPRLVARHVDAFVRGLQAGGVAACAKHFPGHGRTDQDSHLEIPIVPVDRETLFAEELVPFRSAVDAGVRSIMTAHIRVPAVDDRPATLSQPVLHGLLREELGFDGMVITDALEMQAVSATVGVEEGAVQALAAGADALCVGRDVGPEAVAGIHRAVVQAVASGRLPAERIHEAARRVEAAGGLASSPTAGVDDRTIGLEAARGALRADGDVQLRQAPLVIELSPRATIAAGEAGSGLGEALRARLSTTEVVRVAEDSADRALAPIDDRPLVIVIRDAHLHAWERSAAEALLAARPDAIVVDTGLPSWRPTAAGYLATYGSGRVNLEAAAERLTSGL